MANVRNLEIFNTWDTFRSNQDPQVEYRNNTISFILADRDRNRDIRGIWDNMVEINQILGDENVDLTPLNAEGIHKILYCNWGVLNLVPDRNLSRATEKAQLRLIKLLLTRFEVDSQLSDEQLLLCFTHFSPGDHRNESFQEFRNACAVYQQRGYTPLQSAKIVSKCKEGFNTRFLETKIPSKEIIADNLNLFKAMQEHPESDFLFSLLPDLRDANAWEEWSSGTTPYEWELNKTGTYLGPIYPRLLNIIAEGVKKIIPPSHNWNTIGIAGIPFLISPDGKQAISVSIAETFRQTLGKVIFQSLVLDNPFEVEDRSGESLFIKKAKDVIELNKNAESISELRVLKPAWMRG